MRREKNPYREMNPDHSAQSPMSNMYFTKCIMFQIKVLDNGDMLPFTFLCNIKH